MVYSEKENLYTDLDNFVFIAQTGILGIQLGLFMALQKKKKVSTVQIRTTEKYPENAILLWNMDEIIADKCHSDKTLWHNQVPLRDKGVSESNQKLQWDDLFWQDTANPRKKHPCLLQENRLGSLESLHECFKEVKVWITGQKGKIILGLNVAFMETTWWILYQS